MKTFYLDYMVEVEDDVTAEDIENIIIYAHEWSVCGQVKEPESRLGHVADLLIEAWNTLLYGV